MTSNGGTGVEMIKFKSLKAWYGAPEPRESAFTFILLLMKKLNHGLLHWSALKNWLVWRMLQGMVRDEQHGGEDVKLLPSKVHLTVWFFDLQVTLYPGTKRVERWRSIGVLHWRLPNTYEDGPVVRNTFTEWPLPDYEWSPRIYRMTTSNLPNERQSSRLLMYWEVLFIFHDTLWFWMRGFKICSFFH